MRKHFVHSGNGHDFTDPEQKRKTIGRLFIEVFEREARRIGQDGKGAPEFAGKARFIPT